MEKFRYTDGYFINTGNLTWEEWQAGQKAFDFLETERSGEWITLNDASRNIFVSLPLPGGTSYYAWGGDEEWKELYPVERVDDPDGSPQIRDVAQRIIDQAVPEGRIIRSNENPPLFSNDFLKYTNSSHAVLLANWLGGGIMTACNGFVNWYAHQLGITGISNWFELEKSLKKCNKAHAWVPAASGARPKYGDILRHTVFHVDVAIGFKGNVLSRVAAGQGDGSKYSTHPRPRPQDQIMQEYDVLRRVSGSGPYNWQNLTGWLDIELFFS